METKENLKDYQLGNIKDFDFQKILDILKNIHQQLYSDSISQEDITKSYINSLFTPLLSYSIEYLNENKEKPGQIGKAFLNNIEIIYLVLNKQIYDLFFQRKKGKVFEGKNVINYERNYKEDNYPIYYMEEEKELDAKLLEDIVLLGEKKKEDNESIEEIFNFKKKEIISSFRLGYSMQERILNTLISNSDNNKIFELPNVVFYKNNKYNKLLNEVDRIITVEKDTKIKNFFVFSKTIFKQNTEPNPIQISEGEALFLPKNSCNFIEVKTSMKYLLNENKKIKYGNFKIKTPSEKSSIHRSKNNENDNENKMLRNIEIFSEVFKNFGQYYNVINLIIIIDSCFQKNYIKLAEEFAKTIPKKMPDFNLIFAHIEPDITYECDINNYQKINELKEVVDKKSDEIKTLQKDSKNKEKEITQLKKDSIDKEKEISQLKASFFKIIDSMKKELSELSNEKRKKKLKKGIRKCRYDIYSEQIIKDNMEQIKENKLNYVIGNYYNDSFQTLEKCNISNKEINILIDFKTFIRLPYSKENKDFILDIESKHKKNLKELSKLVVKKIILLVDFVFILNINEIMSIYFKDKEMIIEPISEESYTLFLLTLKNKPNAENKFSLIFKGNVLDNNKINLEEISSLSNFIDYFYELNESKGKNNLEYFPLYNPLTNKNTCFLSIREMKVKNEDIVIMVCTSLFDYENLSLVAVENCFKYLIIIFCMDEFNCDDNFCNNISQFYFNKNPDLIIGLKENKKVIFENELKCLRFFNNNEKSDVAIIDKTKSRVQFKFKLDNMTNKDGINYTINQNNIIDKKIEIIFKEINMHHESNDILIEEPFNIIFEYLNKKYNKSNFVLLNGNKDENILNIQKKISTIKINAVNQYLLQYLNNEKDSKFDLIVSANNLYCENEESVKHKFLKKDNLTNIKIHLKEEGIFCFFLFLNNIYNQEKIMKKLEIVFKENDIFIFNHKLDYVIICKNN